MYPNIVLSAWQLVLMIAVPVVLLFGWIIAIFIADRPPRVTDVAASASSPETATAGQPKTATGGQPQDVPARLAA